MNKLNLSTTDEAKEQMGEHADSSQNVQTPSKMNNSISTSINKSAHRQHKALFLDRDGVINVDHGYVGHYDDFEYVNGIFDVIRMYASANYKIVVVTNQSGIARGRYNEDDFHVLMDKVKEDFADNGISEIAVYYCPHHVDGSVAKYAIDCACRKPKPGMLIQASQELGIALNDSVLIGDSWRDIEAAHAAGLKKSVFLSEKAIPTGSTIEGVRKIQCLQQLTALE